MRKMYEYIEIKDNEGGKVKYKNLTPKQARDKMKEWLKDMEDVV